MTRSLDDILRQPAELRGIIARLSVDGQIAKAAAVVAGTAPVMVVGIGSSYNAALAVAAHFTARGRFALAVDASEMLHFMTLPHGCTVIILSRSGRSIEVVRLLDRLEAAGAQIVAVTNTPESPLAQRVGTVVCLGAAFDHNVSFTMYSGLGLAGALVAAQAQGEDMMSLCAALHTGLGANAARIADWQARFKQSDWFDTEGPTTFLARGASVATCHEARLLWEEVAKQQATALPTGGFRHGSQEMVRQGVRLALWQDRTVLVPEDRLLLADLRRVGAKVMLIGESLGDAEADLLCETAPMPAGWQFLVDILPAQLASEYLAGLRGEDADSFKYCSFVIEGEAGLGVKAVA